MKERQKKRKQSQSHPLSNNKYIKENDIECPDFNILIAEEQTAYEAKLTHERIAYETKVEHEHAAYEAKVEHEHAAYEAKLEHEHTEGVLMQAKALNRSILSKRG